MLDTVTSAHFRRSYRTGLVRFLGRIRVSESAPTFTKALVGEYRAYLLDAGLSAATVDLRLAPVRRFAREMADDGLLDPAVAAAVGRVSGVARHGTRLGNGLTRDQANDLLNAPKPKDPGRQARPGGPRPAHRLRPAPCRIPAIEPGRPAA